MAIWQINFLVLPELAMADYLNFKDTPISEFDGEYYWNKSALSADFIYSLNTILPKTDWYTPLEILFGNEDSNRVTVLIDNNIVQSVSFRIDFRSQYELILRQLITFCEANNLIVFDEHLQLIPLEFEAFNIAIKNHKQVKTYNKLANS